MNMKQTRYYGGTYPLKFIDDEYEPVACEPMDHPPGTNARIEEIRRRAELGQELFHEEDRNNHDIVGGELESSRVKLGEGAVRHG